MGSSIKYIFLLTFAYIKRFKAIIVISILLGIILFLSLLFLTPYIRNPKVERIGISGRYYSDTLPRPILALLSDGLTSVDSSGLVEPAIAESWETPDKGKTWIFKIKKGLRWHDGTAITSDTLVYDFSDVQIERPDPLTIIFKLDQPFAPFPSVVSTPLFKKGLIGLREWKVKNISVAGSYIEKLELVNNKKETKLYRFYPTVDRTSLAFKLGEIDTIENMYDPTPFDTWKTASVTPSVNTSQVVTLFFNTQNELTAEKSIRQALAYGIDKQNLLVRNNETFTINGERAISSIPSTSWSFNPQVKLYDFDQKRAKELIDALPKEQKTNLSIKLSTNAILLPVAEKIANYWRTIGVQTSVQIATSTQSDYQAFLTMYDIPKDPDQYTIWHSTQVNTNISHYSSPRIDKILEDGRTTIDLEERRKIYLDFQRFLIEDLPALFLYHPVEYQVTRK
jgi:peptide/nickel transport system substrate-binding protein